MDLAAEIAAVVARRAPVGERAQAAAEAVRAWTGRRWVGIYEVTRDEVVNVAWSGPTAPAHPRFPVTMGLSSAAIAERRPIVSNDVTADPRYLTALESTGSELIVPVMVEDEVVGTLDIEDERVGAFAPEDVRVFEVVAAALRPLYRAH
jgi:L-methionine (R)-S-oxide reductase